MILQQKNYDFNNNNIKLGMNVAYRYWQKINKYPNIYISLDDILTNYHADNIHKMIIEKKCEIFILHERYFLKYPDDENKYNVFNYKTLNEQLYLLNSSGHITTGIMSIRLCISFGFKNINIYGMNGSYVNFLPESKEIEYNGKKYLKIIKEVKHNPNYFFDNYQQIGDEYNIPNNTNKTYNCNCMYHIHKFNNKNGGLVKEPLHKYAKDVLFFDLKRFFINYKYEEIENGNILKIL